MPRNLPGATSHADHVRKELEHHSHLANPIPLPIDLSDAVRYIRDAPDISIFEYLSGSTTSGEISGDFSTTDSTSLGRGTPRELNSSSMVDLGRCSAPPPLPIRDGGIGGFSSLFAALRLRAITLRNSDSW